MAESTLWWLAAGIAVGAELLTGTFYLLMLALGLAAGAVAAHTGASFNVQLVVVALVSVGAIGGLHRWRARNAGTALQAGANKDVNMDVGETLQVDVWNADGTAQVKYRGANWTATAVPGEPLATGAHRVREVVGNRLVVEKI
ncbi:MAG: NfeD family protein [Burkholderiales bacterium]|nr:NfeD family protein [Burkholderiales bacterium]